MSTACISRARISAVGRLMGESSWPSVWHELVERGISLEALRPGAHLEQVLAQNSSRFLRRRGCPEHSPHQCDHTAYQQRIGDVEVRPSEATVAKQNPVAYLMNG